MYASGTFYGYLKLRMAIETFYQKKSTPKTRSSHEN